MGDRIVLAAMIAWFAVIGCGGDGAGPDAGPDGGATTGTITLSWSITSGGGTVSCGDVNAFLVSIQAVREGDAFGVGDAFGCNPGTAETRELEPGRWDLTVDLLAPGAVSLLAEELAVSDIDVVAGQSTAVPVTFVVPVTAQ